MKEFTFLIGSIILFIFIIIQIRKNKMLLIDAIIWFIGSFFLLTLAIFPPMIEKIKIVTGIQSSFTIIMFAIIIILILILLNNNIKMKKYQNRINELTKDVIILKEKVKNKIL